MDPTATLFEGIDRSGPVPLYFQLARRIEDAIEDGRLPPGTKLENELKLAEDLRISRPTVRRAIQELVTRGLLVRRRGIGTQVVHGKISRKLELTSLFDDLVRDGKKPTTEVLLNEVVAPTAEVAEALDLAPGQLVLHTRRFRSVDDDPLALLENFLPAGIIEFSSEQLAEHGLYQLLRARGATMRVAKQRIGARGATREEAKLFGIASGSPVLTMARTLYGDGGQAIEYGKHSYVPETYSFEMTLVER
ncbi:MAG: GntR family transcriptional regulator [Lacisediminihabitans sp.]